MQNLKSWQKASDESRQPLSSVLRWNWKLWKSSVLAVTRGTGYLSGNLKATAELLVNAPWRFLQVVHSDAYWSFWRRGSMRGVKCTAPDGTTVLLRSAKAVTQHIKASTGEDVSEYFVNETAADAGELLGFQLSHATDEEQQQLLWGGIHTARQGGLGCRCHLQRCHLLPGPPRQRDRLLPAAGRHWNTTACTPEHRRPCWR